MVEEKRGLTPDPLDVLPLGRVERRQMRDIRSAGIRERISTAESLPEGENRDLVFKRIKGSLERVEPVQYGSSGMGSGVRHTRQSIPDSETIL